MLKLESVRRQLSNVYNQSNSTIERFNILHEVEVLVKELRQQTIDNLDSLDSDNISEEYEDVQQNTLNRIVNIIAWQSGMKDDLVAAFLKPEVSVLLAYDEFGFDSLDMVEIVMSLEEEFEVMITDEEAERCRTVQCIIDLVTNKA